MRRGEKGGGEGRVRGEEGRGGEGRDRVMKTESKCVVFASPNTALHKCVDDV